MRLVFAAMLLLAGGAAAQPATPREPLEAAALIRDELAGYRRMVILTAAYRWCGVRPPEWGAAVFETIMHRARDRVTLVGRATSSPGAYWRVVDDLWDEHWRLVTYAASITQFSASQCLDAQRNTALARQLDALAATPPPADKDGGRIR